MRRSRKSGPSFAGQFGLSGFSGRQPSVQLSFGVAWFTHFTRAALHVERDHGVGRLLRRVGVAVAGGDVDHAALGIDRRRRPDAAAGRAPLLHAVLVLAARLRLVDGVGLPQHLAGVGVERGDAAAERAALVLGVAALAFFVQSLHRHEDAAVVHGRRAGDRRRPVLVDLADPDLLCRCSRPRRRRSPASRRSRHA